MIFIESFISTTACAPRYIWILNVYQKQAQSVVFFGNGFSLLLFGMIVQFKVYETKGGQLYPYISGAIT